MTQTVSPALGIENAEDPQPAPQGTPAIGWLETLRADTPDEEKRQRPGGGTNPDGTPRLLTYVTARFVQDRLDDAVGPLNWQNSYIDVPGGVRAGIGIRIPDTDEWVWKWDFGQPSTIEPGKGAHSDAFKRAGVKWGIARDLYDERDDAHQPQPQAAAQPQAQPQGGNLQQQVGVQQQFDPDNQAIGPGWVCPIHDDVKIVPAGFSNRTQKSYNAFRACPVAGCDQKEPFRR